MISLSGITKTFDDGATWVVRDLALEIPKGEFLVLLGESGCGKTTTLKMINRLVEPSGGVLRVDGENAGELDPVVLRRSIGYVFQGVGLFPHFTVAENVGVVPRLLKWSPEKIAARVDELLDLVVLPADEFRDRYPAELSGGQRQRVGFARALAARPKVLLMDEPFGALDPITRDSLQVEVRRLHDALGLTTVMVTHDMVEALLLADRIAVMSEGGIAQIGTPSELLHAPANDYVAELLRTPQEQARKLEALAAQESVTS